MLAQLNSRSRGYSVFKWLMVEPRERVWALPVLLAELWSGESGLEQGAPSGAGVAALSLPVAGPQGPSLACLGCARGGGWWLS